MERQKNILLAILFVLSSATSMSAETNKLKIYNAYISNQMENWQAVVDDMEITKTDNIDFLSELVNYQYGYIGYCLAENDKKSAKKYLALAEKNLETLEKMGYSLAMVHAYKSAFWGFKIGISPIKAPFYGSKCLNHANESLNASNQNSFGLVQYGMAYFYMPAMFGGSKKTAVKHFLNALKLMEAKPNDLEHNWNYLNLLTLIGQSYEEIKEYEKSKIHFEQALKKEPDFLWVKKELMPELLKKMK